jgi:hypothetical protein
MPREGNRITVHAGVAANADHADAEKRAAKIVANGGGRIASRHDVDTSRVAIAHKAGARARGREIFSAKVVEYHAAPVIRYAVPKSTQE